MRILFLTHRLPYAPNRGDRIRAFHILQRLSRQADVDLVSLTHDAEEAAHADELRSLAATVTTVPVPRVANILRSLVALPTTTPTTHTMLAAPELDRVIASVVARHTPDLVFAYCSGMARAALAPRLNDIPMLLDLVDVDSAKWAELAVVARWPLSWVYAREARVLSRFERQAARHARATLVVTDRERETLTDIAPEARIHVVPNGVDIEGLEPPDRASDKPIATFCGVMNYPPNEVAALWLAQDIWPAVRDQLPAAQLRIVGATPSKRVRALASQADQIEVTGTVPDVRPFLWESAIAVAPLHQARGVQNKVLEAVAAGLPTVTTSKVMAGLPEEVHAACLAAETVQDFIGAIVKLLSTPSAERRAIASRASLTGLSWERRLSPLESLIQGIGSFAAPARSAS